MAIDDYIGQKLGNYHLIKQLGRGGFADVYLGEHIYLQTLAAIKVVRTKLTEEIMQKFLVEARTIARLNHPNIIAVLEFGVENETTFLVMTYAPHGSLRHRHPIGSILPPSVLVPYIIQIAEALQHAHDREIIHCDVKPENMLIGPQEAIMLSDFGIAIDPIHHPILDTRSDTVVGTATYMAPEQFYNAPSAASDQYALAVIAYEWCCGDPPFLGTPLEIAKQHLHTPPVPLNERHPTLSPTVAAVIMQALHKDPQQRYPSIRDFAIALKRASLPNRQQDRPESLWYPSISTTLENASQSQNTINIAVPMPALPEKTPEPPLISRRVLFSSLAVTGVLTLAGTIPAWPILFHSSDQAVKGSTTDALASINSAQTRPALTTTGPGSIDLFIRSHNNTLWHGCYNNNNWQFWEQCGSISADPVVTSWGPGQFDLCIRDNKNSIQHRRYRAGVWSKWESLGGPFTSDPALIALGNKQLAVIARNSHNGISYNSFDGTTWHNWIDLGGESASAPAITSSNPGQIDVLIRARDNTIRYIYFDGQNWHNWISKEGEVLSDPTATSWSPGRLDVFARAPDNTLAHTYYDGTWHGWTSQSGPILSSPAAISWGVNTIFLCARSVSNELIYQLFDSTQSNWQPVQ